MCGGGGGKGGGGLGGCRLIWPTDGKDRNPIFRHQFKFKKVAFYFLFFFFFFFLFSKIYILLLNYTLKIKLIDLRGVKLR